MTGNDQNKGMRHLPQVWFEGKRLVWWAVGDTWAEFDLLKETQIGKTTKPRGKLGPDRLVRGGLGQAFSEGSGGFQEVGDRTWA